MDSKTKITRRQFVEFAVASTLASSITPIALALRQEAADDISWNLPSEIVIDKDHPFDLSAHLPKTISKEKIKSYFIDETNTKLPAGVTLSKDGLLSVSQNQTHPITITEIQFGFELV